MKEPKIVLKNIKTFQGLDGEGFNAVIWINDVKCMLVIDTASGGEFDYQHNIDHPKPGLVKKNIDLLAKWIDEQPKVPFNLGGEDHSLKYCIDMHIENVLIKTQEAKEAKKLNKICLTGIAFGVPNGGGYEYIDYNIALSVIPKDHLQHVVNGVKEKYCIDNKVILNKNIEELGVTI